MFQYSAFGVRHRAVLFFILLSTILLAFISFLWQIDHHDHGHRHRQESPQHIVDHSERRIGTPLGLAGYPLNFTISDYDSVLVQRGIDETYDYYVCKGDIALNMIIHNSPSKHVWTQQDIDNAWEIRATGSRTPVDLEAPLRALRIPHGDYDVHNIFADQSKPFTDQHGRANNRPTTGYYRNAFIPHALRGTIIASRNYSPRTQVQPPTAEVPPLNRWSDIVWILWTRTAGSQAGKLRYIFRDGIANDVTRAIIDHITDSDPGAFRSPWPGKPFDMRTDFGKALLGTPHGIGVAFLIADHSDVLGRKIPLARIFTADDYEDRRRQTPGDRSNSGISSEDTSSEGSGSNDDYNFPYYLLWELRDTATG